MFKINTQLVFTFIAVFLVGLSILVANRDISVGYDTVVYVHQFQTVVLTQYLGNHEIGFAALTLAIANITSSYKFFLGLVCLVTNLGLIIAFRILRGSRLDLSEVLLFLGFLFFSSWYQTATLNALRQGISLPFLYSAFVLTQDRRYKTALSMVIVAIGFHNSAFLALPFFVVAFWSVRTAFATFIISAIAYALGVTELAVEFFSNLLGLSFYRDLISYSGEYAQWFGFQLSFYLYSVFWGVFYYVMTVIAKGAVGSRREVALKTYLAMMLPYFYFAHGAFSNRFAFIGWLFIPFLHANLLSTLPAIREIRVPLSLIVFVFGFVYFSLLVTGLV